MPKLQTPRHSRQSSTVEGYREFQSPRRRQSQELDTPYRSSFRDDTPEASLMADGDHEGDGGMGNLADELADAFSESGEDEMDGGGDDEINSIIDENGDSNRMTTRSSIYKKVGDQELEASHGMPSRTHRKIESNSFDGSAYGSDQDFEVAGVSPGLLAKIDAIESLAMRGTGSYGGSADDAVNRVTEALRDLGSQSSIEASASR